MSSFMEMNTVLNCEMKTMQAWPMGMCCCIPICLRGSLLL